jgi:hypothetical protein
MSFQHILLNLAALLAFSPTAQGFTTACNYQEYKCGYSMIATNGIYILALTYLI